MNWATSKDRISSLSGDLRKEARHQIPRNAAELVRLKVDVIVTGGPTDTRAAKAATSTIPIVMTNEGDPVGNGLVVNGRPAWRQYHRAGGLSPELNGKRLELLKESLPRLSHVVALRGPGSQGSAVTLKRPRSSARSLGLKLQFAGGKRARPTDSRIERHQPRRVPELSS